MSDPADLDFFSSDGPPLPRLVQNADFLLIGVAAGSALGTGLALLWGGNCIANLIWWALGVGAGWYVGSWIGDRVAPRWVNGAWLSAGTRKALVALVLVLILIAVLVVAWRSAVVKML